MSDSTNSFLNSATTNTPIDTPKTSEDGKIAESLTECQAVPEPSQQTTAPFLKLPGEIRNMIYGYACNWNDVVRQIEHVYDCDRKAQSILHGPGSGTQTYDPKSLMAATRRSSTPTILLLCKQITAEALGILHRTPFLITAASLTASRDNEPDPSFPYWRLDWEWHPAPGEWYMELDKEEYFRRNEQKIHIEIPDRRRIPVGQADWAHSSVVNATMWASEWLMGPYSCPLSSLKELVVYVEGDKGSRFALQPTYEALQELMRFMICCLDIGRVL